MYITHDSRSLAWCWRHSDDQLAGRGVCVIAGHTAAAGTLEFLQLSVISIDLVLAANPLTVASWHPPLREKPTLALLPFLSPVSCLLTRGEPIPTQNKCNCFGVMEAQEMK